MAQTAAPTAQRTGKVVQVIGPVIDIEFPEGLPEIHNAVRIVSEGGPGVEKIDVIAEVEQHLGENRVRTVAMKPTDGMQRGMQAIDLATGEFRQEIPLPVRPSFKSGNIAQVEQSPVERTRWNARLQPLEGVLRHGGELAEQAAHVAVHVGVALAQVLQVVRHRAIHRLAPRPGQPHGIWGLLMPYGRGNFAVHVNGELVSESAPMVRPYAEFRVPLYFEFPAGMLHAGANTIDIHAVSDRLGTRVAAAAISLSDSPRFQRSHNSVFSAAVKPL